MVQDGFPSGHGQLFDAFKDRADAVGFVGRRGKITCREAEFLMFGADGELGGRPTAFGEMLSKLTQRVELKNVFSIRWRLV